MFVSRASSHISDSGSFGRLAALWGILGFVLLVGRGLWRLVPMASAAPFQDFLALHWVALALSLVLFGYGEGVLAIQKGYLPRLVSRAHQLADAPSWPYALLAPLYCMGLIGTDARTLGRSWGMVVAIVLMILGMRFVPTPWREIVLMGVVVALAWAMVVSAVTAFQFMRDRATI